MSDRSTKGDDGEVPEEELRIQFDADAGSSVIGDDVVELLSTAKEERETS